MKDLSRRQQALEGLELEMRQEMAAALGRIGRTLTESIETMLSIQSQLATQSGAGNEAVLGEYREARKKAQLYYWYLLVQREALGLRNHADVRRLYRIPPAL